MALSEAAKKWYESFLKELTARGLDLTDPMTSAMIRLCDYAPVPGKDDIREVRDRFICGVGTKEPEPNHVPCHEDIAGFETIPWFKSKFTAPEHWTEAHINEMFEAAKRGGMYLLDARFNLAERQVVYVKNDGTVGVSLSQMKIDDVGDNAKEVFPDSDRAAELYQNAYNHQREFSWIPNVEEILGYTSPKILTSIGFRNNLLADYFANPDYYATEELAVKRGLLIRTHTAVAADYNYYSQHPGTQDHEIGSESTIKALIERNAGKDAKLDELLRAGLIRRTDGTPFECKTDTPWSNGLQLADYLNTEKKVVIFRKEKDPRDPNKTVEKRVGHLKLSLSNGNMKFYADSPTKGNDYSARHPTDLEDVELSAQLLSFARNLKDVLRHDAQFSGEYASDVERLKVYHLVPDETGRIVPLEENALEGLSLNRVIVDMENQSCSQEILHRMYGLMESARSGNLVVTRPGELLKDAHPVTCDGDGAVTLLPSKKDATREQLRTGPYLFGATYAGRSAHAEDAVLAKQQEDRHKILDLSAMKTKTDGYAAIAEQVIGETIAKGLSREQLLEQVKKARGTANSDPLRIMKQAIKDELLDVEIPFRPLPRAEQRRREDLSKKALETYFGASYDMTKLDYALEPALEDGQLTWAQIREVKKSRDLLQLVLKQGNDPGTIQSNIDMAKLLLGVGAEGPEAEDIKKRMAASVFNNAMQEISEVDYSRFEKMSDAELVENWPEYMATVHRISIFKLEYQKIQSGNPYINTELGQKCLKLESEVGGAYYDNSARIRMIANPYYAKLDTDALIRFSGDVLEVSTGPFESDKELTRLMVDAATTSSGMSMRFQEKMTSEFRKEVREEDGKTLHFFDKEGKELPGLSERYQAIKDGTVFACSENKPETVIAFDQNAAATKEVGPELLPAAAKRKISKTVEAARGKRLYGGSAMFFLNGRTTFLHMSGNIADEILGSTKLNRDVVLKELQDRTLDPVPRVDADQMLAFAVTGDKTPEKLPVKETEARRKLTAAAIQADLDYQLGYQKAVKIAPEVSKLITHFPPRIFDITMLRHEEKYKDDNQKFTARFFNGSPAERTKCAEEVMNRYLDEYSDVFTKQYTDEELVKNWTKITAVCSSMGQEYISMMSCLKQCGVTLKDELLEKMEKFHSAADQYNSIYRTRMDYIMSSAYQYGVGEMITSDEQNMAMVSSSNAAVSRAGSAILECRHQERLALVEHVLAECGIGYLAKMEAAYDKTGKRYTGEDCIELAAMLQKGETMYFFEKGKSIPAAASIVPGKYPQKVTVHDISKDPTVIEMGYDNQMSAAEDSNLNQYEKEMESAILGAKYKLNMIMKNPKAPDYDTMFRSGLEELMARVAVRKVCEGKKLDEDTLKELASSESYANFLKGFRGGELSKRVMESMPKTPTELLSMSADQIYRAIIQKQAGLMKEQKKQQELQQAEARKRSVSAPDNAARIVSAFSDARNARSFEMFGLTSKEGRALLGEGRLRNLTVDRGSLQAMAVGILLGDKKKYPLADILNPEKLKEERAQAAQKAMEYVKTGDPIAVSEIFLRGLKETVEFADAKMGQLKDFSQTELAKPENRLLLSAVLYIKDFQQEYGNALKNVPKGNRNPENDRLFNALDNRGEVIGMLVGRAKDALITKEKRGAMNNQMFSTCIMNYLMHTAISGMAKQAVARPENAGKPISEILGTDAPMKVVMMQATTLAPMEKQLQLNKLYENPKLREEMLRSVMDDTARLDLEATLTNWEGEPKPQFQFQKMMKMVQERVKAAVPAQPEKKAPEAQTHLP